MLLPKSTLEQIEFYSVTEERIGGTYTDVNDVITLHYKQWWKRDQNIRLLRTVEDIDVDTDKFYHRHSDDAAELLEQLRDYMCDTFSDSPDRRNKAQVLKMVVNNEE